LVCIYDKPPTPEVEVFPEEGQNGGKAFLKPQISYDCVCPGLHKEQETEY